MLDPLSDQWGSFATSLPPNHSNPEKGSPSSPSASSPPPPPPPSHLEDLRPLEIHSSDTPANNHAVPLIAVEGLPEIQERCLGRGEEEVEAGIDGVGADNGR